MNCWDILGIEPDADKKTIKLAYAKLLKKTRPDDDPAGFKILHTAYKEALRYSAMPRYDDDYYDDDEAGVERQNEYVEPFSPASSSAEVITDSLNPPLDSTIELKDAIAPETSETLEAPLDQGQEAFGDAVGDKSIDDEAYESDDDDAALFAELDRDWDYINTTAQELVRSPQCVNDVKAWRFIESVPSMVDLEFRTRISNHLFGLVAEVNQISLEKRALYIKAPVLDYLNDFFQWDQNWSHLEMAHGDLLLECVFPYLSAKKSKNAMFGSKTVRNSPSELFYYARIGAFTIDLIATVPIVFLLSGLTFDFDTYMRLEGFYLLLMIPIMEASKLQASLGKRLFKLVVVNKQGLRIPWYQSFWRSWVSAVCLLGFKVVVWINLYLSWRHNVLLQDYLSRSYVMQLRD